MRTRLSALVMSMIVVLAFASAATAGLNERSAALGALRDAEETAYLGNAGSIDVGPGHPSILFSLLDSKAGNDNGVIGSTDTLIADLTKLSRTVSGLVAEDDDFNLVQVESVTVTGYTFTERLSLLSTKLYAVLELLPDAGINNEVHRQRAIDRTLQAIADVEAMAEQVESNLRHVRTVGGVLVTQCLYAVEPVSGTLSFRTWYDIEEEWDYGFVEVSDDVGFTWEPLEGSIATYSENPNDSTAWANSSVAGYRETWAAITGASGSWVEAIFVIPDDPASPGEPMVRFCYYTDELTEGAGWYIDDVTVNGFSDDFGSGSDGWFLDGWEVTVSGPE